MVEDFAPVYVETIEGLVKSYEKVYAEPNEQATCESNLGSGDIDMQQLHGQAYDSRRPTGQTEKMYDDTRPTSTTGPSFGHFGRPFSHQLDGLEHMLQASATLNAFPVDPSRIVLMQRTVGAQPGFGIPVSALGEFGVGFGSFSPFGDSLLQEDLYADDASVKRSAYVETVSDEDVSPNKVEQLVTGFTQGFSGRTPRLLLTLERRVFLRRTVRR